MKKALGLLAVVLFIASCNPKQQWLKDAIDKKEKALLAGAKTGNADTATINGLLRAYQEYATRYPTDTTGAEFLYKAADFYRYMHQAQKSIELYNKIYTNYPTINKRPYALFLQGFMYENELNDIEAARTKYQQFLNTYPEHPFAKDVRATINNLGKTPEQLIQEFEAKEKADSAAQVSK